MLLSRQFPCRCCYVGCWKGACRSTFELNKHAISQFSTEETQYSLVLVHQCKCLLSSLKLFQVQWSDAQGRCSEEKVQRTPTDTDCFTIIEQGIFFRSSAGSVAATQWDAGAEDLVDAQTCLPEGALRALRESVLRLEMDASLG